jgi:hypothetical protein
MDANPAANYVLVWSSAAYLQPAVSGINAGTENTLQADAIAMIPV